MLLACLCWLVLAAPARADEHFQFSRLELRIKLRADDRNALAA